VNGRCQGLRKRVRMSRHGGGTQTTSHCSRSTAGLLNGVTSLAYDGQRYTVQMADAARASMHTIIIASRAAYRRPELENLSSFEGGEGSIAAAPGRRPSR